MIGRGGYRRTRTRAGLGQTPSVTSEIISPGDPRYVDIYPNTPGGGIVYPDTTPYYLAAPGGTTGSTTGTTASAATSSGGDGTGGKPDTGGIFGLYGPFAGGGGGGGFSPFNLPHPNISLPNWCTSIFGTGTSGQTVCGGNLVLYLILAGVAVVLLSQGGRR